MKPSAKASNVGIASRRTLSGIGNKWLLPVPDNASQAVSGCCLPHPLSEDSEIE